MRRALLMAGFFITGSACASLDGLTGTASDATPSDSGDGASAVDAGAQSIDAEGADQASDATSTDAPADSPADTPTDSPADGPADASADGPLDSPLDAPSAPIAFVQANSVSYGSGFQSSAKIPFVAPQNGGDLIVVVVSWYDDAGEGVTVTDTNQNTYNLAAGPVTVAGTNSESQLIYYAANINAAAAGANSVGVSWAPAAGSVDVRVAEYSGLDPNNPFDATAWSSGTTSTASSGATTTHYARELIVGAGITMGFFKGPGSGFTSRQITNDGNILEDRIVNAAGSYSADGTVASGVTWLMQVATFH